jgi:predicted DNA-binding transcriptional regulator AlpA
MMLPHWPHMMKADTAAQYCDLSRAAFIGEVAAGRLPSPVNLGGREHWFRPALD